MMTEGVVEHDDGIIGDLEVGMTITDLFVEQGGGGGAGG
jgi:hypothetical protein